MKFISDVEWKRLQDEMDEKLLNEILSRVHNSAVEKVLTKLPEVISRMISSTVALQNMTKDFFARNSSFQDHKDIAASVIQDVESLHPDWTYEEVLKEAEGVIKLKIEATKGQQILPLDKPKEVNLDGNGVL